MPKKLPVVDSIWTREKWKAEREDAKYKVPKGAVSGLNMGETIAKFHASHAKSLKDGYAAAKILKEAFTKYKNGIKVKYKAFHDRIENQPEHFLNDYIKMVPNILASETKYPTARVAANREIQLAYADFQHWKSAGSEGKFKSEHAPMLQEKLEAFQDVLDNMTYVTDKVAETDRKNFETWVKRVQAKAWDSQTFDGLITLIKKFPASL